MPDPLLVDVRQAVGAGEVPRVPLGSGRSGGAGYAAGVLFRRAVMHVVVVRLVLLLPCVVTVVMVAEAVGNRCTGRTGGIVVVVVHGVGQ